MATALLKTLSRELPNDPDVWYLVSRVVPERERQTQALKRALGLKPDHAAARQALASLQQVDDFGLPLPTPSAVGTATNEKSYTGHAVLVLALYFVLFVPGLIAAFMFEAEAARLSKQAGHNLPGLGALRLLKVFGMLLGLLLLILLLLPTIRFM